MNEKCHKVESSCICILDKGHAEIFHECRCGGQYGEDEKGNFIVGKFPDLSNSYSLTGEEKEIIKKANEVPSNNN